MKLFYKFTYLTLISFIITGCLPREKSSNLVEAISRKQYQFNEFKDMLEANPERILTRNSNGDTLLKIASLKDRYDAVKLLIELGANVNAVNSSGRTALHSACHAGNLESAKLLLDTNSIINIKDNDGSTPLLDLVEWSWGSFELFKLLIVKGADIHVKNSKGETALDIVNRLIQQYSSPSKEIQKGFANQMVSQLKIIKKEIQAIIEKKKR